MASAGAVNERVNENDEVDRRKYLDEVDRRYFNRIPAGFRFRPTGEELIVDYLRRKVLNLPMPANRIRDVNLYNYHPQQLTNMFKLHREKEWYFFTPRERKYPNGFRPDRGAGNGYWKATGAVTKIFSKGVLVGFKNSLVYYEGRVRDGKEKKTGWLMQEYTMVKEDEVERAPNTMKLDKWVLCIVYKNLRSSREGERAGNEPNDLKEEENTATTVIHVPNQEADSNGEGVNNIENVAVLNEQVPSQNQEQWQCFINFANVPTENEQVRSQNQEQWQYFINSANAPTENEQVPSQNQEQWQYFINFANVPTENEQVPSQNQEQWQYFNNFANVPTNEQGASYQNQERWPNFNDLANVSMVNSQVPNDQNQEQWAYANYSENPFPYEPSVHPSGVYGLLDQVSPFPYEPYNFHIDDPVLISQSQLQWQYNVPYNHNGEPVQILEDYSPQPIIGEPAELHKRLPLKLPRN